MKGKIYKITNKVNGKVYIGQTRYTLEFRWKQHIHKKDNTYFHNAIKKYGPDNFQIELLEECPVEILDSREVFYIAKYNSFKDGYNLTIGGDGKRKIISDNQYNEIKELYLSGFSSNKIAELFKVDKATILKILHLLDVKIRKNNLDINRQEFEELVSDYQSGYSLKELAKRYNCSASGLKEFLEKKGVDLRKKYNILNDTETQESIVIEYLGGKSMKFIEDKYHLSYATIAKVLSLHGISRNKKHFKLTEKECLEVIALFNSGNKVSTIARVYKIDKCTVYSILKRYHVNYQTV